MKTKVYEQDCRSQKENAKIAIELMYHLGGWNCIQGQHEHRGLYLHIRPMEINGCWESFDMFSGRKFLIQELNRKSEKKHQELWNKILPHTRQLADYFEKGEYQSIMDKLKELL